MGKIDWWYEELPEEKREEINKNCFPAWSYGGKKLHSWEDLSIDQKLGIWRRYAEWSEEHLKKVLEKLSAFLKGEPDFQKYFASSGYASLTFEESVDRLVDDIAWSDCPMNWMQPDWWQGGSWFRAYENYYVDIDNVWDSYVVMIREEVEYAA